MTDENYQKSGDNGIGGSWGTGDSLTAAILTEIEKRVDDELKKFKAGVQGDGVILGLAVSEKGAGANQSVDVASGSCFIDDTKYTEASTVNVALDAAHGTYARWDIITYDASAGNPSKVTGTAGAIPTIPDVPSGDIILALVLRAANDNTVSDAEIIDKRIILDYKNKVSITVSDTLLKSDDAEGSDDTNTYIKAKTITIPSDRRGNLRIKFAINSGFAGKTCWAKILRDGVLVGAEQSQGNGYATKSQDINGWSPGEDIELWFKSDVATTGYYKEFRIYGTEILKEDW